MSDDGPLPSVRNTALILCASVSIISMRVNRARGGLAGLTLLMLLRQAGSLVYIRKEDLPVTVADIRREKAAVMGGQYDGGQTYTAGRCLGAQARCTR